MTKPHTTKGSGDALSGEELASLIMDSVGNLIDRARVEILARLDDLQEDVGMIAAQIQREAPKGE